MAELSPLSANIRLRNEDDQSVCFISGVSPTAAAETVVAFVKALEIIYNGGPCAARMNVVYDILS